jgi:hypothetical protein
MSLITLLKNFTYAGGNGNGFVTDWVRIPEHFQNWQLVVEIHGAISTSLGTIRLATTWDTGLTSNPGASVSFTSTGLNSQDINTGMGPMIRVAITSTADSIVTMSVYLTPKSD